MSDAAPQGRRRRGRVAMPPSRANLRKSKPRELVPVIAEPATQVGSAP